MSETMRLSDILSRAVAIEWFEAVALTREVAERVRENLGGQSVPELHQIELSSEGRVSLSGASRTEEPVRRLGQLLQAALVESDPPVQLRLLGSQATAPTPAFASIREYIDALEYFERPDREGVLRALYQRAAALPVAEVRVAPTLDEIAPLNQAPPKKEKPPRPQQPASKRGVVPAFAAAVVVVVGGATYWQLGRGGVAPSTQRVSDLAVKASDAVGTAVVAGLSSVTDSVGLGRLAPSDGSGSVPVAPPPPPKTVTATQRRQPVTGKTPVFRLFDLAPDVAAGLPVTDIPPVPVLPAMASVHEAPILEQPDSNVYSSSDPEVDAPIGVRPQLPAVLPSDIDMKNLSKIEVLVLPDGSVGSVKLIGRPRSVLEGMLLSAAKAWKFRPAMKGNQPVTYRKLVWLVLE
jgi:hypothetical protein